MRATVVFFLTRGIEWFIRREELDDYENKSIIEQNDGETDE